MAQYKSRHTGKQIDDLLDAAGGASRYSFFDNGFFSVNQRGAKTFTQNAGTAYAYGTVDRWRARNAAVTVNDDGSLTISKIDSSQITDLSQTIEPSVRSYIVGKTITMSALMQDGTLYTQTFVCPDTTVVVRTDKPVAFVVLVNGSGMHFCYRINADSGVATIRAVKLELGSVSTLANDSPPNYAEELAKCQRYFYRIHANSSGYGNAGTGVVTSATRALTVAALPVEMRANPTLAYRDLNDFRIYTGATFVPSALAFDVPSDQRPVLRWTISGGTVGQGCTALISNTSATGYIDFSADL